MRGVRYGIVASFVIEVVLLEGYAHYAVLLMHIHTIWPSYWDHITLSSSAIAAQHVQLDYIFRKCGL
jgi:hypothetical protein